MFYTIIKRIPGSQGTKVSVVYSHVSEQTGSIDLPLVRRLQQRLSTLFEGQQLFEPILTFSSSHVAAQGLRRHNTHAYSGLFTVLDQAMYVSGKASSNLSVFSFRSL